MSAWKPYKLGDIVNLKRGYDLPKQDRIKGTVPIYTSAGLTDYHGVAMKSGPGVITGRYGTLGEVFYCEGDYWPHNTTLYVTDFKGNNPRFVFYLLQTLKFNDQNDKTSVPGLNRNHLHEIWVTVPDTKYQKRIAEILTDLDDKIELNRQMNQTLEEMAQAMFKHYFVDAIDEDNLPEGWRIGKVADIVQHSKQAVNPGNNPETLYNHYSLPAYDEKHQPVLEYGVEILSNKGCFKERCILYLDLRQPILYVVKFRDKGSL